MVNKKATNFILFAQVFTNPAIELRVALCNTNSDAKIIAVKSMQQEVR